MATNPDAATKADDNNTNDETNNNNNNDNNENTTNENENDKNQDNNDSKPNKEVNNEDDNNKAESDKNIHVPKDKKLKIESVKVKEAISDNDIIFYDIYVKTAQNHWIVRKRYSEFEDLHNMLIKFTKSSSLPVLPPKHYKFFTDHADPKFIEQRRALLDNYVRRLIKLKDISSMQPVVNFFHDSKAIQINGMIHKNEDDTDNNNTDNNNDNNNNPNNNEEKLDDKTNNNNNTNDTNNNNNNNNNNSNNNNDNNTTTDKIDKLVEESLSPNAKIVVKCEENYSFPSDQEITGIEIQSLRKMSDHVLYQILVKNEHREEPYDKWTVMKRFHNIYMLDQELRKDFQNEERNDLLKEMPLMPERKSKLVHDHMDDAFMEARQVLLQNYFNKMLRIEDIAKNKKFLSFFGVEVD